MVAASLSSPVRTPVGAGWGDAADHPPGAATASAPPRPWGGTTFPPAVMAHRYGSDARREPRGRSPSPAPPAAFGTTTRTWRTSHRNHACAPVPPACPCGLPGWRSLSAHGADLALGSGVHRPQRTANPAARRHRTGGVVPGKEQESGGLAIFSDMTGAPPVWSAIARR